MSGRKTAILYVIGSLEVGGAERQIVQLCQRLDRHRFVPEVAVLGSPGPLAGVLEKAGVVVHTLNSAPWGHRSVRDPRRVVSAFRAISGLQRLIQQREPAVLHAFLPEACLVAAMARKANPALKFIAARRSLLKSIASLPLLLQILRFVHRRADVIHVNSEAVRHDVIGYEGGTPQKVTLIYNGVDTRLFQPRPEPGGGPRIRVGMLANFIPYKGHRDVVLALASLKDRFPALELWLWGREGPSSSDVRALAVATALDSRVRFLGVVDDPATALRQIDVFVSASREEGFSNSILEAMASGLPIVATAIGGTVEQIEDTRSGLLVPAGNPEALAKGLLAILCDDRLAGRLGKAARERATLRFSLDTMVAEVTAMYERMVNER